MVTPHSRQATWLAFSKKAHQTSNHRHSRRSSHEEIAQTWSSVVTLTAMLGTQAAVPYGNATAAPPISPESLDTESPIKHVIVLIGENRSFDHTFATYEPRHGQTVANLLSKGIIDKRGQPGARFADSAQFQVNTPLPSGFFISLGAAGKTPYAPFLPSADLGGAPNNPIGLVELTAHPSGVQPR